MDGRATFRVFFGLAQHFAGDGRGVAFAKEDVFEDVDQRIAFGPREVGVRNLIGAVAQVEQESGNRVRHRRGFGAQHAVAVYVYAFDRHHIVELRRIADFDFEKSNRVFLGDVIVGALLDLFIVVLGHVAALATVGDDANLAATDLVNDRFRALIQLDVLDAQFRRAVDAREERRDDDEGNEERCDLDAFGPLDDVGDGGVD